MQAERTIFSLVKFETLRNLRCDVRRRRGWIKFVSFLRGREKVVDDQLRRFDRNNQLMESKLR